jgi:hypothetical protein
LSRHLEPLYLREAPWVLSVPKHRLLASICSTLGAPQCTGRGSALPAPLHGSRGVAVLPESLPCSARRGGVDLRAARYRWRRRWAMWAARVSRSRKEPPYCTGRRTTATRTVQSGPTCLRAWRLITLPREHIFSPFIPRCGCLHPDTCRKIALRARCSDTCHPQFSDTCHLDTWTSSSTPCSMNRD